MWLIVGLGNPGPEYEWTRHNCGFLVIEELARRAGRDVRTPECQALTARVTFDGQQALLVKPQTFMNLSGVAVAALKQKHQIANAENVLVISDDLALPFGKLRIRPKGSAGGQNGLKSIVAKLGTQDFPRVRLGIAPKALPNLLDTALGARPIGSASDFVLSEFPKKDREALAEQVALAADAVEVILTKGIAEAMSIYN